MAGCSKKQYAIMMSAGSEGKKLASEMGSMDQDKFDAAFSELLGSNSYKSQDKSEKPYSRDDDEDYREFDAGNEDDFGFDELSSKESSPMNEFSGPDREGPSYAQLESKSVSERPDFRDFSNPKTAAIKYMYGEDISKEEFDNLSDEEIQKALNYYHKMKPGWTEDEKADWKKKSIGKYNELWDSLESAQDLDAWQAAADKALDSGEISEEQYDELNEALDKRIDAETQNNFDKSNFVMDERGQAVPKAYYDKYGKKKYNISGQDGSVLGEPIEAGSEEEAFNEASKRFPGRGDELQVQEDVKNKPQRFTKSPDWKDYLTEDQLKELRDYEYYSQIDDFDKKIKSEQDWKQKTMQSPYHEQEDLDKIDRRIAMLSNPNIQKYVNDRNAYNKQLDSDFNEYKPLAKQKIIEKLLGDNDLYRTSVLNKEKDDFDETDDLFDELADEFQNKYGYERRYGGENFSHLRPFATVRDEEERIGPGQRRSRYNKEKYLAELLSSGEITLADLRKFLGKK